MRLIFIALWLSVAIGTPSQAAADDCKPQPLGPAIEAAGLPPSKGFANVVTFGATPSLEYPGRAWVIRLFQDRHARPATLTVVRLLRRSDCNLYLVETRWEVPIHADEYEAVATQVAPLLAPTVHVLSGEDTARGRGISVDGTSFDLRVETTGWQIRRLLTSADPEGQTLSKLFRRILTYAVPEPERPGEYWTARR
jgi:hypothetical protein